RRGDHSAERLRLEREHLELARAKLREKTEAARRKRAVERPDDMRGQQPPAPQERGRGTRDIFDADRPAPDDNGPAIVSHPAGVRPTAVSARSENALHPDGDPTRVSIQGESSPIKPCGAEVDAWR
ncbi:MAG: hypothetical protein N2689_06300, partial [Verrucomicrobiae bacterium]|nr:hypothetical protein [Verrucomicrobiae bacterium]